MGKTMALFSGGKDGMYALVKTGVKNIDLIVTITSQDGANQLHAGPEISNELREAQLELIELPAQRLIVGSGRKYLNELFAGLNAIAQKEDISRLVTGDLWHPYTSGIGDMLAGALGVEIARPSRIDCPSNESSREYMAKVLQSGIESVVIGVRKGDLPREFVGRKIDEEFLNELAKYSKDFAGEGGQYQTFVTSSPIMHGKITIHSFDVDLVQGKNGKESFYRMNAHKFHIN